MDVSWLEPGSPFLSKGSSTSILRTLRLEEVSTLSADRVVIISSQTTTGCAAAPEAYQYEFPRSFGLGHICRHNTDEPFISCNRPLRLRVGATLVDFTRMYQIFAASLHLPG